MLTAINEILIPLSSVWNYKLITVAGIKLGLGNVIVALTLLAFATTLSRLATKIIDRRLIQKFVTERSSQMTYQTLAFYTCLAAFVTLSMGIAGVPLTVFTVFGGALAIGVGFGSQNIVNNFISGIILLVEQPIKVGDTVQLDAIFGIVVTIGTRSTLIRNPEGKVFVVPNSFFLEKSVLNSSYENSVVRTTINFGVAYGSDVKLVQSVCQEILMKTPGVLHEPLPQVFFENFSESNLDFQLHFWVDLGSLPQEIRSNIRLQIDEHFKKLNIEMAFPQRDFNLKASTPLDVKILS